MEEFIRQLMIESAALADVEGRVDWGLRPQGDATPGITLQRIGGAPGTTMTRPDGWFSGRVQVDVWSPDYKQARDLRDAICTLFNGLRTNAGDGSKLRTFILDTGDSPPDATADAPIYRARADITVRWSQAH